MSLSSLATAVAAQSPLLSEGPLPPPSDLTSHHDRDLRARTLTSLLAALSPVSHFLPCNTANTGGTSAANTTQQSVVRDSPRDSSQTWLKLLNYVAQLLVREHEIVAILPKRSGPTAHVNLLVATDNSNDDDERNTVPGYHFAQNARFASSEPSSGNPAEKLVVIHSQQDILQFFDTYRRVSYRNHVLCIEVLFNAVVDAWSTYTTILDSGFTTTSIQEARSNFARRKKLLKSFVTFYSVGKIRRRFHSKPFVMFHTGMTGMRQQQVEAAFEIAFGSDEPQSFTVSEMRFFETLLTEPGANTYLGLSATLSEARALYTKETAWDLHQLLLFVLNRAQATVDNLYTSVTSDSTLPLNISTILEDTQYAMGCLYFLVHRCPSVSAHMKSIELVLSNAMARKPFVVPFTSDLDQDDGVTDTTIEISLAHKEKRVGEECLWLAVRYQAALECLMDKDTMPTDRITLTLCEVSTGDVSKRELHDWKGVMRSIYTPHANLADKSVDISCEEAIETLEEWATLEENRIERATHILRKSSHKFSGCWHAEAVLGTLRHLSKLDPKTTMLPVDINVAPFKYTFNSIGVSKRCCPVCTKLISLLATTSDDNSRDPSRVLASHKNFYPTALPPYLPRGIAVEVLVWLEGLVRDAVQKLVVKRRLQIQRCEDGSASQNNGGRAKSADSKGESPGKKRKRRLVKESVKETEWNDFLEDMGA
ncbi:hypothetical protein EV426DRAFT_575281 [Tirmania nivea]|nr:hypothetical protein EV426DRAFT_575281 [Tirmania nivea]